MSITRRNDGELTNVATAAAMVEIVAGGAAALAFDAVSWAGKKLGDALKSETGEAAVGHSALLVPLAATALTPRVPATLRVASGVLGAVIATNLALVVRDSNTIGSQAQEAGNLAERATQIAERAA